MARKDRTRRIDRIAKTLTPSNVIYGAFTEGELSQLREQGYTLGGILLRVETMDPESWELAVRQHYESTLREIAVLSKQMKAENTGPEMPADDVGETERTT